jgi:hypothetical protein
MTASQARMGCLADGTTVDQEYYQSKNYIMEQLEAKRAARKSEDEKKGGDGSASQAGAASQAPKEGDKPDVSSMMLQSGAVSKDDGWLLASMEVPMRNPFCIANHGAADQIKYYQKVFFHHDDFHVLGCSCHALVGLDLDVDVQRYASDYALQG